MLYLVSKFTAGSIIHTGSVDAVLGKFMADSIVPDSIPLIRSTPIHLFSLFPSPLSLIFNLFTSLHVFSFAHPCVFSCRTIF